jgi:hypothetical protein
MKKIACVVFLAMAMLCVSPLLAQAHGPHGYWGGHGWGGYPGHWSFGFYWGFPGWYYPWGPYGYYPAPPVYAQPQQPQEQAYWYYCQDPQGYYPYVQSCPGGWMKVVPTPTPNPNP